MPLANAKHEAVALAYLTDPQKNGTRAYREVYGCSYPAAKTGYSRLLTNVDFAARIADLHEQAVQGTVMAAQEALERISARARDEAEGHEALQLRALELMGKHHVLFTEKHVHEFGGVAERLAAALERIGDRNAEAPHEGKPKRVQARRKGSKSNPSRRRSG